MEMQLVQRQEPKSYNGTLRRNEEYVATAGDPAWKQFIHTSKRSGSQYMYVDLLIASATSWSAQTSSIGTPIFEGSFLWRAFMADFGNPEGQRIINQQTGDTGRPFVGWFETAELEEPVYQLWRREGKPDQWNLVESTRIFVHEADDPKRERSRAIRYIMNQADDPAVPQYQRNAPGVNNSGEGQIDPAGNPEPTGQGPAPVPPVQQQQ